MTLDLVAMAFGLAFTGCFLGGAGFIMAMIMWSKVVGLENSTHQIQYVPIEDAEGQPIEGDNLEKNMTEAMGMEKLEREYV